MRIGVPKELKNNENRVAMTPAGVVTLKMQVMKYILKQALGLVQDSRMKIMPKQAQRL